MPIKADRHYSGKVEPGSTIFESRTKGTLGFRVNLRCEDGSCHHDIWLSEKTYERAVKTFVEVLGVRREDLSKGDFVANKLPDFIVGREVEFDTEGESYVDDQGEERTAVKVKWLNRPGGSVKPADPGRFASFFGKPAKPLNDFPDRAVDPDCPF